MGDGLEKARKRLQEMKEQGVKVKIRNTRQIWEDNKTSLRKSINAMCWECMGGEGTPNVRQDVRDCKSEPICPLWYVRPWK